MDELPPSNGSDRPAPETQVPGKSRFKWAPAWLAGLAVAALTVVWGVPGLERIFRVFGTVISVGLASIALSVWFLFFSTATRRTKLTVGVLSLLAVVALCGVVRVKEFTGDVIPVLTWSWTPVQDRTLQRVDPSKGIGPQISFPQQVTRADFSRFLGNDGTGKISGVRLETDWGKFPPKERWRKPIGAGWSAFATVGDFGVTQEQRGDRECVSCYDLLTGDVLWSHYDPVRFSETLGGDGPRATPTINAGKVYALGGTGILNCLEGATGKLLWSRDILKDADHRNLEWGKSSSPLVTGDLVIVTLGHPNPADTKDRPKFSSVVVAFDRTSGKLVWKSGEDHASYASPVLAKVTGGDQVLVVNAESLTAHDPQTGWVLWTYPWLGKSAKCSNPLLVSEDRILLSAGYGIGSVLLHVTGQKPGWKVREVWKSPRLKTRFCNAVVRGEAIFGLDDGILLCQDLKTGERKWQKGRYGHGQILLVDDLLLVQAESGELALVAADPTRYQELSRIPVLHGKTWNNPALSGNRLLVRNAEEAVCLELSLRSGG